uniref:Uncharacterized protein n=1 Tax=Parascaris equorum TaxID=6256 RepID=A0A914RUV0_PAREQ
MNELDNANDEVFMTEEFNELTWKKKIVDPRVPESEKQFGGKIIYSLPLGAAQREFLKFSRTRQVDRPISWRVGRDGMDAFTERTFQTTTTVV